MQVDFAFLCKKAKKKGLMYDAIDIGIHNIVEPTPVLVNLDYVARVVAERHEIENEPVAQVTIQDPRGNTVKTDPKPISTEEEPDDDDNITIALLVEIEDLGLAHYGMYKFRLTVNEKEIHRLHFHLWEPTQS